MAKGPRPFAGGGPNRPFPRVDRLRRTADVYPHMDEAIFLVVLGAFSILRPLKNPAHGSPVYLTRVGQVRTGSVGAEC